MPIISITHTVGNLSGFSGPIVPDGDPSNLVATTYSDSRIDLSWTNGATNQEGTAIYYSETNVIFTLLDTVVGLGDTYSAVGLDMGTQYFFKVAHYIGAQFSFFSNTASATTIEIPNGDPSNLIVTTFSDSQINLTWTNGATNQNGTAVFMSTDNITFVEIDTVLGAANTYSAIGLNSFTLYFFKVAHYVGVEFSAYSNTSSSTTEKTPFVITVDTTKAGSPNNTMIIPTNGTGYNFDVDWGDNSGWQNFVGTAPVTSHVYAFGGVKTIKIRGLFPTIYFNNTGDRLKLLTIEKWGDIVWSTFANAFYGCANLTGCYGAEAKSSAVVLFGSMFRNCTSFNSAININTSNATSFSRIFYGCTNFNGSVSTLNTSNVITMSEMFYGCSNFNQSVSNFNTANVTTMSGMFSGCGKFNQSVANFNTAKVTVTNSMFSGCTIFNQSVSSFNTSQVLDMAVMFSGCAAFNQSVANFNTSKATTMSVMFNGCTSFKQSLAAFNMELVDNVAVFFSGDLNEPGTTTNYDNTLVSWAAQNLINSKSITFGTSKYSAGTGAPARAAIIADDLWTITDGGQL